MMNKYSKKNASEFIKNNFLDGMDDSDFSSEENHNFFSRNYEKISNCTSGRKLSKDRTAKLIDIASHSLERSEYMIIRSLEEKYNQKNNYNSTSTSTSSNTIPSINIVCCYPSFLPPIPSLQTSPNNLHSPIISQQQQSNPYYSSTCLPNQMPPIPPQPILPFNQLAMPFLFPHKSTKKRHKKFRKYDENKHKKDEQHKSTKEEKKKIKKEDKKKNEKEDKKIIKEFKYNEVQKFEGILNYLYTKTNGNIHDNGTIEITASSQNNPSSNGKGFTFGSSKSYHPKTLLNGKEGSRGPRGAFNQSDFYAAAKNDNTFWVRFDFKNMKVSITSYVIQNTRFANVSNIRNWVIEISDDGDKWDQIDSQNDCSIFQKSSTTHNFEVKETKFVRYVRFRHTGNKWSPSGSLDTQYIGIQAMEFFGKLKE